VSLYGVDVSDWQGSIDWPAVASWARFGVCKATEGTGNVQTTFEANRRGMAAAGMGPVGLYHFARPENNAPLTQAVHFCDVVRQLGRDEFVVLDVETGDVGYWPEFIDAWCREVARRLGGPIVVYMSESPAKSMPAECAAWPLWVAGYVNNAQNEWEDWRVGPWATPAIWQYSSSGNVPGVDGRCDVNVAPDDLRARIGLAGVSLPPSPPPAPSTLTGWAEIDRFLLQEGVAINVPPEDWQTTGGTHAATSWHYQGMARDYSTAMGCDEAAVVEALRPFAVENGPLLELFHAATNTWWPADVGGHTDHAHAAIAPGVSLPVVTPKPPEEELTTEEHNALIFCGEFLQEIKNVITEGGDGDQGEGQRRLVKAIRAAGKSKA
jgi:lysozyme